MPTTEARIGVVGATGVVGTVALELLAERGFSDVRAYASSRSAGSEVQFGGRSLHVEEATPERLAGDELDLCFFSVGTGPSSELVPPTAEAGTTCIDKSDAFRLAEGIPLVVAGVNDDAIDGGTIVANPNCSAIQLLRPQAAARRGGPAAGAARDLPVDVGRGRRGVERLRSVEPMQADLSMDWDLVGDEFDEELKLREETRKILGAAGPADPGDLRPHPGARRPRPGDLGRDRGAALAGAGGLDPRGGAPCGARGLPDPELGGRAG